MTGLYWSTLLNCSAHSSILTAALSAFTPLSVFVVFVSLLRGKHAIYIYIYIFIQTPLKFGCIFSEAPCVSSSLKLNLWGLNNSLTPQRHTGQTTVLQALILGHMRSDYSTTKLFVDNFLLSTLWIMSTNRCSPKKYHNMFAESSPKVPFHSHFFVSELFDLAMFVQCRNLPNSISTPQIAS